MLDLQQPGSSKQYQNIHINGNAKAQLGDTYHISREDPLSLLPLATQAPFNSYNRQHEPACLPGTRVELLQDIYDWADRKDEQDERFIFWLNGLAGTGKSTISRTVARRYNEQKRLGASFFFSKGGGDVSHAGKFFTSLAVQLTRTIPSLQKQISDAIAEQSNIASLSLSDQWRQLVLSPLSRLEEFHQSYVLVVDALDECEGDIDVRKILELLAEARSLKTIRLLVFLTSRPEIPIRHSIHRIPQADHQDFILQNIPPAIINHDISLFLDSHLGIIRQEWTLGADWPGEVALRRLVLHACGLFIWAATACRFIRDGRRFARKRLDTILQGSSSAITAPAKQLNEIYLTVLRHSISSEYSEDEKKEVYDMLKHTLGSIVVLLSPLSTSSLCRLLHLPRGDVDRAFEDLYAILDIPEDSTRPLRLHHPSFRDFLLNKDRCGDFWVDEKAAHQVLAAGCIQLMSQTLKKDICEMHAPGSKSSQVESSWIQKCLPPEVQYACLYWVQHLQKGGSQVHSGGETHRFLQTHLLHWFEALGWMGKMSEGVQAILSLEAHILVRESPNLHAFIHDAKRFALSNRLVIEKAPLQLYSSALIFAPERSLIRNEFEADIPTWIQVKPKVQTNWNAALQTLEGHTDWVKSATFSLDGKQVVSCSNDKTVRLWDANTGVVLQTLEGHTDRVNSAAFSPDSKQVVSCSGDGTVRLWDVNTGAALQILKGHRGSVYRAAFSPDSKQLVSCSDDKTVRLWDVNTGVALQRLDGHRGSVYSAAFSPDSKQLVSCSDDKTVRLWEVNTGVALQTLEGHRGSVYSAAFSPDSKQVVSCSGDGTVRLWDVNTGAALQILKGHRGSVYRAAFSPDSKQLVSCSDDKTVRLWDVNTGVALQTLEGHRGPRVSVILAAFSPDSKQVVSWSGDYTVQLWDVNTGTALQTLEGHTDRVNSAAFSPDSKQVVSCSDDFTIRLWDANTGALQTLEDHTDRVKSVAFSPDGKQVVSCSDDYTVRLWDANTAAVLQTLEGHTDRVNSAAFSPDSKQVVSCSDDFTIRLWDANTGAALQTLEGHTSRVNSAAFSPDGKQVVSRSDGYTVLLWDANTGAALQTLQGHRGLVYSAAFSPDLRQMNTLLVSNKWVVEGGTNFFRLPLEYRRPSCLAVWNQRLVLGYRSGRVFIIGFKDGSKAIY